jgi:hypothetical protein
VLKNDAVNFFGNKTKLANAAGVKPSSVSVWGELVPEGKAMRLQIASGGVLKYDPVVYDQLKEKRRGKVNDENQSSN